MGRMGANKPWGKADDQDNERWNHIPAKIFSEMTKRLNGLMFIL